MKIEYDKEVGALYIRIQEKKVSQTKEVAEGVNLDFDEIRMNVRPALCGTSFAPIN